MRTPRLNWRPRRFKWTRPFRRKTKSGFCACSIAFQKQSNSLPYTNYWSLMKRLISTYKWENGGPYIANISQCHKNNLSAARVWEEKKNFNSRHATFRPAQGLVYCIVLSTRCKTVRNSPWECYESLRVSWDTVTLTVNLGIRGMPGADWPQRK